MFKGFDTMNGRRYPEIFYCVEQFQHLTYFAKKATKYDAFYFPETQVFQSELSMDEIHNMDQLQLWERTAKEILSSLSNDDDKSSTTSKHKFKYLAIHSATRYESKEFYKKRG